MSTSASPDRSRAFTDAGIEVTYCIVTDGDAGGVRDRPAPRGDGAVAAARSRRAAAAVVGVHELQFLGYPDGRVEPTLELRRDIAG